MLGFIIAVVAGFLAKYAEDPLARPLAKALDPRIKIEPGELRLLSFMAVMLIAGVAAEVLDSGSTLWSILGGIIGYFATRLIAAVKALVDGRGGV